MDNLRKLCEKLYDNLFCQVGIYQQREDRIDQIEDLCKEIYNKAIQDCIQRLGGRYGAAATQDLRELKIGKKEQMNKHKLDQLKTLLDSADENLAGSTIYTRDSALWGAMHDILAALDIIKSELSEGEQNG